MALAAQVLVVDDFAEWRRFVCSNLEKRPGLRIVAQASNGAEAVQKAQETKPDVIILDVGLPGMNGLEAARQIREGVPPARILFFSETRSWDVVEEALRIGAGYVLKADAHELWPALEAVLEGRRFVSSTFAEQDLDANSNQVPDKHETLGLVSPFPPRNLRIRHEVQFYTDDAGFADGFARLVQSVLHVGNPVIVIATESHRREILSRLRAADVDVESAIEQGSYISLDSAETLSGFMDDGMPDPVRCASLVNDLLGRAEKQAQTLPSRIAICGECSPTLLEAGNAEGAIRLEHLWDEITGKRGADTLCGYLWNAFPQKDSSIFRRICAEHSAVHGRELAYEPM